VKATVSLTVADLAKVEINWPAPNPISYGTPLSNAQLNATASVPGTFAYGPGEGNVLPAGKHTLLAVFTPDNPHAYAVTTASITMKVDALPDAASLLTAHIEGDVGREVEDELIPEINEREMPVKRNNAPTQREVPVVRAPAREPVVVERVPARDRSVAAAKAPEPEKVRETRTYKGVIYEKGDDGQWHRL
jgi:hypothetical protein